MKWTMRISDAFNQIIERLIKRRLLIEYQFKRDKAITHYNNHIFTRFIVP